MKRRVYEDDAKTLDTGSLVGRVLFDTAST
jgi:hypothetical protein